MPTSPLMSCANTRTVSRLIGTLRTPWIRQKRKDVLKEERKDAPKEEKKDAPKEEKKDVPKV